MHGPDAGRPIYLDYNATTPVAAEVLEAVLPALREAWGNPSSRHAWGRQARQAVDRARAEVAGLLGCAPSEIVFTSGGTESDNAAIIGVAEARAGRGRHVVTTAIEHPAVEAACGYLERRGWSVTRVLPGADGRVRPAAVAAALRPDTVLVSVMHANNESGIVQPLPEISRIAHERGVVVHTDAAQSVGKLPVRVDDLGADLLTVAGHKLYAPKGVGALYLRAGTPFAAFLHGGSHEGGRRPGTENTPAIVGLGAACALAAREADALGPRLRALRDRLEQRLLAGIPDAVVHGGGSERLPNTLSIALPGIDANRLLDELEGVAAASGAACHAGEPTPSRVLRAMGVPDSLARSTLRLSVGRPTTPEEVDAAALRIHEAARRLRPTSAGPEGG
jgi:cysteine desulfurase